MSQIDLSHLKIGVVVSRFNPEITNRLLEGAVQQLEGRGLRRDNITVLYVPGAVEIPLVCQALAKQKKFSALIALGAVIRGETDHYRYVCESVTQGCNRVALDFHLPVIFGVLTTDNEAQALDRLGGAHGHKGRDAADTALEMVEILRTIE